MNKLLFIMPAFALLVACEAPAPTPTPTATPTPVEECSDLTGDEVCP